MLPSLCALQVGRSGPQRLRGVQGLAEPAGRGGAGAAEPAGGREGAGAEEDPERAGLAHDPSAAHAGRLGSSWQRLPPGSMRSQGSGCAVWAGSAGLAAV